MTNTTPCGNTAALAAYEASNERALNDLERRIENIDSEVRALFDALAAVQEALATCVVFKQLDYKHANAMDEAAWESLIWQTDAGDVLSTFDEDNWPDLGVYRLSHHVGLAREFKYSGRF